MLAERAEPGDGVVVVRVDQRAVDVEDRGRCPVSARPTLRACASCSPSQNSSTIFAQNAGRSSGLREVTRPSSTYDLLVDPVRARVAQVGLQRRPRRQRAAAHDVGLDERPRAVADDADRLGLLEERAHEADGVLVGAQEVGIGDAARQDQAVVVARVRVLDRLVDGERVGLVEVVERLHLAILDGQQLGRPPACSTAFHGSVSSTCSTPSAARNAIFLPFSSSLMARGLPTVRPRFTPSGPG